MALVGTVTHHGRGFEVGRARGSFGGSGPGAECNSTTGTLEKSLLEIDMAEGSTSYKVSRSEREVLIFMMYGVHAWTVHTILPSCTDRRIHQHITYLRTKIARRFSHIRQAYLGGDSFVIKHPEIVKCSAVTHLAYPRILRESKLPRCFCSETPDTLHFRDLMPSWCLT